MKDIKIELDKDFIKPTIQIDSAEEYIDCLIDTGAFMPVWTLGEHIFERHFKGNFKKTDKYASIGGFGYGMDLGSIYEIKEFILHDVLNGNKLVIHNLPVVVVDRTDMSYKFILSTNIFNRSRITLDYMTSQPYMRIEAERDLYARYKLASNPQNMQMKVKLSDTKIQRMIKEAFQSGNMVESIYVFTQDEADINHNPIESLDF